MSAVANITNVRLVNGTDTTNGRLEVQLRNGSWGTVCDDSFNATSAAVVCRQLGLAGGAAFSGAYFGAGVALGIAMDEVTCTGAERSLGDCPYDPDASDCSHSEDVAVICSTPGQCNRVAWGCTICWVAELVL